VSPKILTDFGSLLGNYQNPLKFLKINNMNLPSLNALNNDQSTYITFSKSLTDLDKAISTGGKYYFTKMVALNLPVWHVYDGINEFTIDLSTVGVTSDTPNMLVPKTLQFYMENIIRQSGLEGIEEIVEIAFWKTLKKMGLTMEQVDAVPTFANKLALSNFVNSGNNNGWSEIIGQIPNKCAQLTLRWRPVNVPSLVQGDVSGDVGLYDNGLNQFIFAGDEKVVLDFDNFIFDDVTVGSFDFNCLLLFYMDDSGTEKLHGINFIYPFENKVQNWAMETFTQKTNILSTIGYQFIFNMKSCNNEATQLFVYELQEHSSWNTFSETLGKLNSFLEIKMRDSQILS